MKYDKIIFNLIRNIWYVFFLFMKKILKCVVELIENNQAGNKLKDYWGNFGIILTLLTLDQAEFREKAMMYIADISSRNIATLLLIIIYIFVVYCGLVRSNIYAIFIIFIVMFMMMAYDIINSSSVILTITSLLMLVILEVIIGFAFTVISVECVNVSMWICGFLIIVVPLLWVSIKAHKTSLNNTYGLIWLINMISISIMTLFMIGIYDYTQYQELLPEQYVLSKEVIPLIVQYVFIGKQYIVSWLFLESAARINELAYGLRGWVLMLQCMLFGLECGVMMLCMPNFIKKYLTFIKDNM